MTITGGITRASNSGPPIFPQNLSFISGGTLDLAGGLRPFQVDNDNPIGLPTTLTISSVIANGGVEKTGLGLLALSGDNVYTGNTTVSGGVLELSNTGELLFDVENGGVSNRILGSASATFDGTFKIDAASLTDSTGSWNLVDVATLSESFSSSFGLMFVGGSSFTNSGGGIYASGRWSFSTANGNLTLGVPEPASALLCLLALVAGGGAFRRGSAFTPTLSSAG